ncbi:hypothetical protein [Frankia gtarii]|uniref:hypothetical protein n=1 Tax=Frankia gtarii TaxID=2950102 RepID=UPI0021BE6DBB|nr:hypothetical protein [Frankia gtarii]
MIDSSRSLRPLLAKGAAEEGLQAQSHSLRSTLVSLDEGNRAEIGRVVPWVDCLDDSGDLGLEGFDLVEAEADTVQSQADLSCTAGVGLAATASADREKRRISS